MDNLPIVVCEIGLNHNGSTDIALKIIHEIDLIAKRLEYPLDKIFYKFQKRNPIDSVPEHMWYQQRVSPVSGREMHYIDYKREIEFGLDEYQIIDREVQGRWFASVWDLSSVDFLVRHFSTIPYLKVPSPHLTNHDLIRVCFRTAPSGIPFILSTGMSTIAQIDRAVALIPHNHRAILMATTSVYPCWDAEVHLNKINLLRQRYKRDRIQIGYSNHSPSTFPVIYSGLLGAEMIEMHVTLNRAMPGSDHSASLEMRGVELVLRELKRHPDLMGPDRITVFPGELEKRRSLRGT